MDGLDLLKKDWNNQGNNDKHLSQKDLYPMLHKKSSSVVKMLFYISIAELVFWIIINYIPHFYSDEYKQKLETIYGNDFIFTGLTILSYAIVITFIYLLYNAYKSISVTDSAKKLMESILLTRKIIKYYVLFNLIMAGTSLLIGFYYAFHHDAKAMKMIENIDNSGMIVLMGVLTISIILFVLVIWLFYKLLYGLLLKRLNKNYNELKSLGI